MSTEAERTNPDDSVIGDHGLTEGYVIRIEVKEPSKAFVVMGAHEYEGFSSLKVFTNKKKAEDFRDFLQTKEKRYEGTDQPAMQDPEPKWKDPELVAWTLRNPYHDFYGYDNYKVEEVIADLED